MGDLKTRFVAQTQNIALIVDKYTAQGFDGYFSCFLSRFLIAPAFVDQAHQIILIMRAQPKTCELVQDNTKSFRENRWKQNANVGRNQHCNNTEYRGLFLRLANIRTDCRAAETEREQKTTLHKARLHLIEHGNPGNAKIWFYKVRGLKQYLFQFL